jgi:hypothetical protein
MDEERQKAIQAILQAGHHAAGLVNRLLGFAARQTSLPRAIQLMNGQRTIRNPRAYLGPRIR